jgi:type III restriction enzyme
VRQKWIRGVNNLGAYGRWAFEEFTDVFEMEKDFIKLIDCAVAACSTDELKKASGE